MTYAYHIEFESMPRTQELTFDEIDCVSAGAGSWNQLTSMVAGGMVGGAIGGGITGAIGGLAMGGIGVVGGAGGGAVGGAIGGGVAAVVNWYFLEE